MFQRCPGFQTPSWFVALLFVSGVILEFQRVSQSSQDGQVNVRENSRKRVISSQMLHPLQQESSIAEK